ncbi:hypothetical protein ACI780_09925 [Geodermatophilus sp. SYSU D00814]
MTHPQHPAPGTVPVGGWTPWGTWDPAAGRPPVPPAAPAVPLPAARAGLGGAAVVAAGLVVGLVLAAVVAVVLLRGVAEDAGRAAGEAMGTSVADALSGGAGAYVSGTVEEVEQSAPVAPGDLGPDPVLDGYAQQCFDGDLQSCDDLFAASPPLSDYEEYALTCGGRVKAWAVVSCTDLE